MTRASTFSYHRRGISERLADGYAQLYADNGVTHEITISPGIHPRSFDPETQLLPQLRPIVRAISRVVRGIPKRQLANLRPEDAVFMAGFYEAKTSSGMLFPHFHGVVALGPFDEWLVRDRLVECLGEDRTISGHFDLAEPTSRSCIRMKGAKPSFSLKSLTDAEGLRRYIRYANKQVIGRDPIHWTTNDILARA